jgi:hypothetical protein
MLYPLPFDPEVMLETIKNLDVEAEDFRATEKELIGEWPNTYATLLLHCCQPIFTLLLHFCYTGVTLFSPCCYTVVALSK